MILPTNILPPDKRRWFFGVCFFLSNFMDDLSLLAKIFLFSTIQITPDYKTIRLNLFWRVLQETLFHTGSKKTLCNMLKYTNEVWFMISPGNPYTYSLFSGYQISIKTTIHCACFAAKTAIYLLNTVCFKRNRYKKH